MSKNCVVSASQHWNVNNVIQDTHFSQHRSPVSVLYRFVRDFDRSEAPVCKLYSLGLVFLLLCIKSCIIYSLAQPMM